MNYKDLQTKAASLGIQAVGVSKENLEKAIQEKEASTQSPTPTDNQNEKESGKENPDKVGSASSASLDSTEENPKPKNKKVEKEEVNDTAVVYDKSREVRRYSLSQHGQDFEVLANAYASHRGYTVQLTHGTPALNCRNCGVALICQSCGVEVK